MAKGPPPQPTSLKERRGNPGKRALNRREPTPPGMVETAPPEELGAAAQAIWREMAPTIRANGAAEGDARHFARACRLEALGQDLLVKAEAIPIRVTHNNGESVSAELMGALKCFEAADKVWFRFGITPSERSRLHVPPLEPPKSKWAGLVAI